MGNNNEEMSVFFDEYLSVFPSVALPFPPVSRKISEYK